MPCLKERLQSGLMLGTMLSEVATPNIARILVSAGFSFIIIDCEHGYFDYSQIAALIAVSEGYGLPSVVRVPAVEREFITKVLDMGAQGLLIPMVDEPGQARRAAALSHYPPRGVRGISTQRAHTGYCPPPLEGYLAAANRRVCLLAQLETRRGIECARDIAAVEGIDAVLIGPNDLAADLGTPGRFDTPEMAAAVERTATAARETGKLSGVIASHLPFLQACRRHGMSVFSCDSEVGMLIKAAKRTVSDFAAAVHSEVNPQR